MSTCCLCVGNCFLFQAYIATGTVTACKQPQISSILMESQFDNWSRLSITVATSHIVDDIMDCLKTLPFFVTTYNSEVIRLWEEKNSKVSLAFHRIFPRSFPFLRFVFAMSIKFCLFSILFSFRIDSSERIFWFRFA